MAEALRPGWSAHCSRCGTLISRRASTSFQASAAFSVAALALYWPANVFPILRMYMHGTISDNTVWQGVVRLYQTGDGVIAAVVFLASMLVPFLKLMGLLFLIISVKFHIIRGRELRTKIFRVIEVVGKWAMLDVFVVAILVSLVKLQRLALILPGKGLIAFSGVVVFTLLASQSFDPALIWEDGE